MRRNPLYAPLRYATVVVSMLGQLQMKALLTAKMLEFDLHFIQ